MNETIKNIITRRSTRAYAETLVSDELIKKICHAATYSASGRGKQAALMVVVKTKELRNQLSRLNASILGVDTDPFYGAPVVVVVLADSSVPTYIEDGSLVMGNLMLAAHSLDISSCWIHRAKEMFETDEGKALLKEWGLSENYQGIGNCILGYPLTNEVKETAKRKDNYIIYR